MTDTDNRTDLFVHPGTEAGIGSLLPYMSDSWRHRFTGLGLGKAPSFGGASPGEMVEYLDQGQLAQALMVPVELVNAWPDPDLTATILSAANDYFSEHWLAVDDRLSLAVLIAGQDPLWSAAEIRRVAGVDRVIAAAIMPMHVLLGHRSYVPIYEACVEAGMPLVVLPTGAEGLYLGAPQTSGGASLTAVERRVALAQVAQGNVNSLIFSGTFERFPELRIVFAGFGFSWLAPLVWRMDMDWRRTRVETPWVKKVPHEYVGEHIRFVTSDPDCPVDSQQLERSLKINMAERVLVYGSGFPLADPALSERFVGQLDDELYRRVAYETSAELWGPSVGALSNS